MNKDKYLPIIGVIISVAIIYLENNGLFFGRFVNKFFSCTDALGTSFPCYGVYDLALIGISALLVLIFLGMFIYSFFKK